MIKRIGNTIRELNGILDDSPWFLWEISDVQMILWFIVMFKFDPNTIEVYVR